MKNFADGLEFDLEGNKQVFSDITRENLELLVKEAKSVKKDRNLRRIKREGFFLYDFEVALRIQNHYGFLFSQVVEFDKNKRIVFGGKRYNGLVLNGRDVNFPVTDLNHTTSAIFSYAVYRLIESNWKRYQMQLKNDPNLPVYVPDLKFENYIHNKLSDYFKAKK